MAKYTHYIRVPFSGSFLTSVQSDEKDPSSETLLNLVNDLCDIKSLRMYDSMDSEIEIDEWECHDRLVRNNVFYGALSEIEIDKTKVNEK